MDSPDRIPRGPQRGTEIFESLWHAKEIAALLLEAGDRVSADIRLREARALYCDEAPLTGESAPVAKQMAALPKNTPIPERANTLFGGTAATYGRVR